MQYLDAISETKDDFCSFPRQTIQYHNNLGLWPTINAEEAEIEQFYEDLQDLLELTPKKDVLFIIRDWNTKMGSQDLPGVTIKFGLEVQNKAGKRLICQNNAFIIANTLFQQRKKRLYTWTSSDGQKWNQTDYILCSQDREAIYNQQKQDWELTGSDHELLIAKFRLNWRKWGKWLDISGMT